MAINDASSLKSRNSIARLELARKIVWRSVAIGLISGSALGAIFGCAFIPVAVWTGAIGAGLGLGLGLVNGLLLSVITYLCFYPLKDVRRYRAIVKITSASIAAGGAAAFGPWYFATTGMTPITAARLGFSSVLASVIAGWAGWLAGQNMTQWYEQTSGGKRAPTVRSTLARTSSSNTTPLNKIGQPLQATLSGNLGWVSVALFALLCSFVGQQLLQRLVCGNQAVISCLPSPRLYTSVIEGFKVTLPAIFAVILIVVVLRSCYGRKV